MKKMLLLLLLGGVAFLPRPLFTLAADGVVFLETFESYPLLTFPAPWNIRGDPTVARTIYRVMEEGGNRFLHARTDQSAIQLGLEHGFSPAEFPLFRWRWRVTQLPAGANEEQKETHDSAAGVYVLFGPWFWPRVIKYVWSTTLPVGARVLNPLYGRGRIVVLESGTPHLGQWREETVNVLEDYQTLFGQAPGPALGIGLSSSASFTRSKAEADYDEFTLLTVEALRAEQMETLARKPGPGLRNEQ